MAGKPLKKKMLAELEERAKSAELTPAEFVHDFIADGKTLVDLAKVLGVSRSYLSRNLNAIPNIREALSKGRLEGADALAEQMLVLSDDIAAQIDQGKEVKNERINILREQNSVRKWLAAVGNPERYGRNDSGVTINLGDLHLDALRKSKTIDITPMAKEIGNDD